MNTKKQNTINIPVINSQKAQIIVIGLSPLITHPMSQKAMEDIEGREGGNVTAKKKKQPRKPEEEFENNIYRLPDGWPGTKAKQFKAACIEACSYIDGVTKVITRGSFHIFGEEGANPLERELVRIYGSEPKMRKDTVNVGGHGPGTGSKTMRYRPEFFPWGCLLTVDYNPDIISIEQIVNILNYAGYHIGIAEMRPGKSGDYFGRFRVGSTEELQKLIDDAKQNIQVA